MACSLRNEVELLICSGDQQIKSVMFRDYAIMALPSNLPRPQVIPQERMPKSSAYVKVKGKYDPATYLPPEMMLHILELLPRTDLVKCLAISRMWRTIANRPCLWLRFSPLRRNGKIMSTAAAKDAKVREARSAFRQNKYGLRERIPPHVPERLSFTAREIFKRQWAMRDLVKNLQKDPRFVPGYRFRVHPRTEPSLKKFIILFSEEIKANGKESYTILLIIRNSRGSFEFCISATVIRKGAAALDASLSSDSDTDDESEEEF